MGVPAFYRWISEKYGKIVEEVLERRPTVVDGTVIPLDLSQPNPNGQEFDNLYLDMNGLIHPCSHPEDRAAPTSEEEMYMNVTKYVDRLVAAIRPRRLLYLAIDGVAPRAKMNQQRSRRFRTAQEMKEKREMKKTVLCEMSELGFVVPSDEDSGEWDSNVITPGTEFMYSLSEYLRHYLLDRMNADPYWRGIQVIISDASEPGEGEHKIMDFIRTQRAQAGYDPNTSHVLHGLDADLIMLALATHEPHFTILREKVTFGRKDRDAPAVSDAQRLLNEQSMHDGILISCLHPEDEWCYSKPLQALHIGILREYLENEFNVLRRMLPFPYDLERIIDDFIFLCFFVGNDFLPHLPSLDIRDGALDFLMECYKEVLPSLGNYLTSPGGKINLFQADVILSKVGEIEDQIFLRKKRADEELERRNERRNTRVQGGYGGGYNNSNNNQQQQQQQGNGQGQQEQGSYYQQQPQQQEQAVAPKEANASAASKLRESLLGKRSQSASASTSSTVVTEDDDKTKASRIEGQTWDTEEEEEVDEAILPILEKAKAIASPEELLAAQNELKRRLKAKEDAQLDSNRVTVQDNVKLHETGWKGRYYNEKFKKEDVEQGGGLQRMCVTYVQGLCWVLEYYYQGVPSWNWYYPFHYAPFASDLVNIDTYGEIVFDKSKPFHPLEQLLAVFPANSAKALPEEVRWLMTDKESPIIDLYDDNVPIDPNGKHLPWLWILLLPFVDETRITGAFEACKDKLSLAARKRNALGGSVLLVHDSNPLVCALLGEEDATAVLTGCAAEQDPEVLAAMREERMAFDEEISSASVDIEGAQVQYEISYLEGHGLSGTLARPSFRWFARAGASIPPPEGGDRWFSMPIAHNRVRVFGFKAPPMRSVHQSVILQGTIAPVAKLTQGDLIAKRPPRLNRSGFNMLDMMHNQQGGGGGGRGGGGRGNGGGRGYGGQGQGYNNNVDSYRNTPFNNNPNAIYNMQHQQQYQQPAAGSYFSTAQSMPSYFQGQLVQPQMQMPQMPQHTRFGNPPQFQQPPPMPQHMQQQQQQQQYGFHAQVPDNHGTGGSYQHRVEPIVDRRRQTAASLTTPSYNLFQQPAVGQMAVKGGSRGTMFVNFPSQQAPQQMQPGYQQNFARSTPSQGASMEAMRMQLLQTVQGTRGPPAFQPQQMQQQHQQQQQAPRGHSFGPRGTAAQNQQQGRPHQYK